MKRKVPPKLGLLLLSCFLLLCTSQAFSQVSKSISGHITDEHGQPLPGVSVLLQGTSKGTTTDQDGFYKISASNGETLVFSYIGYDRKTLEVTASSGGDVILTVDKKSGTLGEVVVIGYGSRQKANVTGAISSISGAELEKSPIANLSNAIAGAVPGLIVNTNSGEPGSDDATILIRGAGTLGGGSNTAPLIVVDGVPDRSFNRLDPGDIESFTVLKDASAAIYGARAANGVILITTKRGKAGKPVLSFTTNYALTQPTRVPQMLNSWQYAQSVNEYDNLIGQQPQYSAQDIQEYKDGSDPLGHPNTDWWSVLMKNLTPQTNNVLSLSGGTDKIKYFISGQDLHQNSMYKSGTDYYNNDNGRVNLDIQATNNFKIGVDVLYRDEYKNGEAPGYDANGIFNQLWSDYPYLVPVYPNGKVGVGIGGGPGNSMVYVLNGDLGYTHDNYDFLQTKTSFSWALPKITSGLHLDGYFAYDDNWNQFKGYNAIPPPAYSYNSTTKQYDEYVSTVPGSLTLENTQQINKLVHLQLGYDHKFGKSSISAFVAYEQEQQTYTELDAYRTGFLSNEITELSAGSSEGETNNSVTTQFARQDYISRISYNYDDRYIIDYNMRYDGSSNFPSGKRFGFFPSVSAAWRISQESFWDPNSIVDNLKLRTSYGLTGNDVVASPFQYLQTYALGTGQGNGYYYGPGATQQAGLTPGATPNLNITWERSKMLNIGVDAELWHSLTASVDVFHEIRYDILVPPTLSTPDYTGISLPDENLGRVQNQGIEIDLGYRNKIGNFLYHINGNMTYAVNKVLYEDEPSNVPSYQQKTGYPIDSWLLYKADGLYQTQAQVNASPHPNGSGPGDIKYVDVNGDGQINALDEVRTTLSPTPQIMFGTTLGGSWKNWDFTIFFQGQARAEVLVQPSGLNMAEQFFTGRWLQPGDDTYPRTFNGPTNATYGSNTYASTFWLKNDAYVRLKNLEIGYTFASSLLKSISVQSLRVYVSGNNLLTFDSLGPSFDPEAASSNNVINGRYYPQQRVFNLGANIKF